MGPKTMFDDLKEAAASGLPGAGAGLGAAEGRGCWTDCRFCLWRPG
jgi:hypothetical protein